MKEEKQLRTKKTEQRASNKKTNTMLYNSLSIVTGVFVIAGAIVLFWDSKRYVGFYSIVYLLLGFMCVLDSERLYDRNKKLSRIFSLGAVVLFAVAGMVTVINLLGIL